VPELPSERRPDPDVPPPPPGSWPLVAGPAPFGPARSAQPGGPVGGGFLGVPPLVGVGLSLTTIALYLMAQLGLQLLAALLLVRSGLMDADVLDPESGGAGLLGIVVASQLAGLVVAVLFLRVRGISLRPLVGAVRPLGRHLRLGIGLGLLAIVASTAIVSLLVALSGSEATPEQVLTGGLMETPLQLTLAVIAAVVLAPIAEELLFRGLLHRGLRRRLPIVPATALSSVLFAVVHIDVALSQPLALVGLTLVGVVLAVAYERSGSLVVPIVIHAVHNAVTIAAVIIMARLDVDLDLVGAGLVLAGAPR
jgi:membrane protease YdiL (CAAX protease family)